jgi:hypothetical protein
MANSGKAKNKGALVPILLIYQNKTRLCYAADFGRVGNRQGFERLEGDAMKSQVYAARKTSVPPPSQVSRNVKKPQLSNSTLLAALESSFEDDLASRHSTRANLPEILQKRMNEHFGVPLDGMRVYRDSGLDEMGQTAYSQGNAIHISDKIDLGSPFGKQVLTHEAGHVVQTGSGIARGSGLQVDSSLERSADVGFSAPQSFSMPASETGPIQMWGAGGGRMGTFRGWLGGRLSKFTHKSKLVEGEHESLTRTASALADQRLGAGGNIDSNGTAKKSLQHGARFNDVYDSKSGISFAAKYLMHNDEFVNQSHHGDMQFLHSMSNGDTAAVNRDKSKRWAEFAIDTRKNEEVADNTRFQDQNMLKYVLSSGSGPVIKDMLMSTMVKNSDMEAIEKEVAQFAKTMKPEDLKRKRMDMMVNRLTNLDESEKAKVDKLQKSGKTKEADELGKKLLASHRSKYAKGNIADFFQGGDKTLDAGMVATGSLSHMLEDSVAGSHGQRTFNSRTKEHGADDIDITNADAILNTLTPVMLHANYDEQDENRHGMADFFDMKNEKEIKNHEGGYDAGLQSVINKTEGARQGQLMAAHLMHGLSSGKDKNVMMDFVDKALVVDKNALMLQRIQQARTEAIATDDDTDYLAALAEARQDQDGDLSGIEFERLGNISTTKGGRQYVAGFLNDQEKSEEKAGMKREHWYSLGKKKDTRTDERKEKDTRLEEASQRYENLLQTMERGNKAYTAEEKLTHYSAEMAALNEAANNASTMNTMEKIRQHAIEILLNLAQIKKDAELNNPEGLMEQIKALINRTGRIAP